MKLRYKTFLYRLIQLVSIAFLPALAHVRAEQEAGTTEPLIWFEVGSDLTITVTLSNDASVVANLASYRLVYREKNKKPFRIRCRNSKGKSIEVAPEQPLPLAELLGAETLPTEVDNNKKFTLTLVPGEKVRQAELLLSIEDTQGNEYTLLPYVWRAKTPILTILYSLGTIYAIGCTAMVTGSIVYFSSFR